MSRTIAIGLAATMVMTTPAGTFAAERVTTRSSAGAISGVARDATGMYVANAGVRIRSASGGNVVSVTQTGSGGTFYVPGIRPGDYVVEALGPDGQVVGVSPMIPVTGGATAHANVTTGPGRPTP